MGQVSITLWSVAEEISQIIQLSQFYNNEVCHLDDSDLQKISGFSPDDSRLQALLRRAIRRDAGAETVDSIFAEIDERVGDDAELRGQAIEMFKLMLSLDYGGEHARKKAQVYVREHGPKKR